MATPNLYNGATTNVDSNIIEFKSKNGMTRNLTLSIWGTWGTATVTLYGSHDGITYKPITNGVFTADYFDNLNNYKFSFLKLTISGAGGTNLNAHIQ